VTDDWSQFPSVSSAERRRIEDADRRLCARADVVVVCSEALEKSRRPLSRRLIRVPNAVDPANYVGCREPAERAASSRRFAAPVFGYVGTLHGDRLDPDLVVCLAREFSHGEVILCGPDYLKPAERDVLCAEENIRILPPVPYSEVPRLLAGFDVCLVPHKLSAFTESLNPIKLWEYLATGKPIAATPVAGFRDFAHLCHLGEGPTGFVAACRAALAEVGRLATERIRAVEPHTWERRAEDVLEVFRQQGWIGAPVRRNRLGEKRRERTAFSSGFRRVFSGPCQGCPTEGISRV
jgi:glycosyltransferase involved in cell wall biosynthesis